MTFPLLPQHELHRLGKVANWAERQMGLSVNSQVPHPDQRQEGPIRGYLLQNVYGNGSGLMQLVYRSTTPNATKISIVGTNYVAGSQFKLQLWGTSTDPVEAGSPPNVPVLLMQTEPINLNSDASALEVILQACAEDSDLSVESGDISVMLGNPVSNVDLILATDPNTQPEIVLPQAVADAEDAVTGDTDSEATIEEELVADEAAAAVDDTEEDPNPDDSSEPDDSSTAVDQTEAGDEQELEDDEAALKSLTPQSYVGCWIINVTGVLAKEYTDLNFKVFQDSEAYLRGLTALVTQPTIDLPGSTFQTVFDIGNRPVDYPWVAGSLCAAVYFMGLGYGLIYSDFRSQSISIPTSSS